MLYDEFLNETKDTLGYFTGLRGTSTGLSPKTTAGLTSLALESVPAQFERQERDLATTLQRQNPAGLPMGGEFLRAYAPLEVAKEQTRAGLLRDLMLEDEAERRRTLDVNNRFAFDAAGQFGSLGTTLEAANRQQRQFDTGLAFNREQADLERRNRLELAELERKGAPFGSLLTSSLLSSALAPESQGGLGLLGKGIDLIGGLFDGGGNAAASAIGEAVLGGAGSAVGTAAGTAAGAGAGTAAGAAATGSGGGLGAALAGFATNPITLAALGGLGAFLLGKKVFGVGNTHEKADEWVQTEQNKFDAYMDDLNRQVQSGMLGPDIASELQSRVIRDYVTAGREFAAKGKDQRRVIDQAFETLRKYYKPQLDAAMVAGYLDVPQQYTSQGWF